MGHQWTVSLLQTEELDSRKGHEREKMENAGGKRLEDEGIQEITKLATKLTTGFKYTRQTKKLMV